MTNVTRAPPAPRFGNIDIDTTTNNHNSILNNNLNPSLVNITCTFNAVAIAKSSNRNNSRDNKASSTVNRLNTAHRSSHYLPHTYIPARS
jgi:hypothetical protein